MVPSSRTPLVVLDYLSVVLVAALIGGGTVTTGRAFWHTHKALSEAPSARCYKRDYSTRPSIGYAVILLLYSLLLFLIHPVWGLVLLLLSILFAIDSYWWVKTPYICITSDKIMVFSAMIFKPKVIEVDCIQDIDFRIKDKILLLLKNGKKVTIKVSYVHEDEDLHVIKALKKIKESQASEIY